MAYSKAAALALLLSLALLLASSPSSSAAGGDKKQTRINCPPMDPNQKHSCESMMDSEENSKDHSKPCCIYVKNFDKSEEAASCLCKYLLDDQKSGGQEEGNPSDSLNKVLGNCTDNSLYVSSSYKCPILKPN